MKVSYHLIRADCYPLGVGVSSLFFLLSESLESSDPVSLSLPLLLLLLSDPLLLLLGIATFSASNRSYFAPFPSRVVSQNINSSQLDLFMDFETICMDLEPFEWLLVISSFPFLLFLLFQISISFGESVVLIPVGLWSLDLVLSSLLFSSFLDFCDELISNLLSLESTAILYANDGYLLCGFLEIST